VEDIIQEIAILSELNSPYVTKYHGSFLKGSDLWIIMEFCSGGSCSDLMRPGLIPEEYITIIIRELLMGLEYLHGDKKLHRDIKGMRLEDLDPTLYVRTDQGLDSCKCSTGSKRTSKACRFRSLRPALCNNDQEEYICWHSFLGPPR
jgi:serine/threonine-protein kinase 24/25/MST4